MANGPANFYLDQLRKLQGAPKITSPHENGGSLKIERVFTQSATDALPDWGSPDPDADYAAAGARLTDRQITGSDNTGIELYTCYEALGTRAQQDLWNREDSYPYLLATNPRLTRKYRFFADSFPVFIIGATADTLVPGATLISLLEADESAVVKTFTATFDAIPSINAQAGVGLPATGIPALGVSITYPYGSKDYPVVSWSFRVLKGSYVAATDSEVCPIPGYTNCQLTDQREAPDPEFPGEAVVTREYQRVPGIVITANIDASKLPRQLTATPAYYLNNEELFTTKQVVAYGTLPDATSATILSSKVEASSTLYAIKTNVTRPDPTLPIKYLPRLDESRGGAKAEEYRQDVRIADTGDVPTNAANLNAAIDSALSLIASVSPWFNVVDSPHTNALSPLEAEIVYTIIPNFVTLYGAQGDANIPQRFLQTVTLIPVEDEVDTTTATAASYLPAFYPLSQAVSCKIVPETIYRAKRTMTLLPTGMNLPQFADQRVNGEGQVESVATRVVTGGSLPDPTATTRSARTDLGSGNFEQTDTSIPGFAVKNGQQWDTELQAVVPYTLQTKSLAAAAGDYGQPNRVITPKDELTVEVRTGAVPAAVVDGTFYRSQAVITRVDFPDVLTDLIYTISSAAGTGAASETGEGKSAGSTGSVSLSATCSAEGSASMMPEITPVFAPRYQPEQDAVDYIIFVPINSSKATILAALTAAAGMPVSPWPSFRPQAHVFSLFGTKGSAQVRASARVSYSSSSDSSSYSKSSGGGYSTDYALSIRAVIIRESIHDTINLVSGDTGYAYAGAGTSPSAQAKLSISGVAELSPDSGVYAKAVNVECSVTPTGVPATGALTAIPTSGLYAQNITVATSSPYQGYDMVRVRVVDFSVLV